MIALVAPIILNCSSSDDVKKSENSKDDSTATGNIKPYTKGIRIAWDHRTFKRLYDHSTYPRMIRLKNEDVLAAFEQGRDIHILKSHDEGKKWDGNKTVVSSEDKINEANPELLQLDNADIILAYNSRPTESNTDKHFGINLKISHDNGSSWTSEQQIFQGGVSGDQGVWEPAMVQRSSGEVQLFFANEKPYGDNNDQEISMVTSTNNGESWSDPKTVSYREGHRDGMPAPLILEDGGIAVAIEDNGIESDQFKPTIVWSSKEVNWEGDAVDGDSDRRWQALKAKEQLPGSEYGGAPYLSQLNNDITLLSFQSTENRPDDWENGIEKATMVVAIGDEKAQNFSRKSEPFRIPEDKQALWNSLFVKNDTTVTALTSTNAFDAQTAVYMKDGYVIKAFEASYTTINIENNDWDIPKDAIIGSYGQAHSSVYTAWDDEKFYVLFDVNDESSKENENHPMEEQDGVSVFLAPNFLKDDAIDGTYKFSVSRDGEAMAFEGRDGDWDNSKIKFEVENEKNSNGYQIKLAIPWAAIDGRPDKNEGWGINFELRNRQDNDQFYKEFIPGNRGNKPSTWSKIELQK